MMFNTRHLVTVVTMYWTLLINLLRLLQHVKRNKPRILKESAQIEILVHFGINYNISLYNIATVSGISLSSIYKITQFHPYEIKICPELTKDDFDRRVQFS